MLIDKLLDDLRQGKIKTEAEPWAEANAKDEAAQAIAPNPDEIVVQPNGLARQAGATLSNGEYVNKYRTEAERSLYVFAKGILGFQLLTPELHGELCEFLTTFPPDRHFTNLYGERIIQPARYRKMCLIPKDHYKTSVASLSLPMHMLAQPRDANIYFPGMIGNETKILLVGETEDLASKNLRWIEGQFENNTRLKAFWPHVCWDNPRAQAKKWNESRMIVRRSRDYPDESIRALGVGGAVQGYHPNCIGEGSLVYTSNGLLPIENIRKGMRVLTHSGHHKEVLATLCRAPTSEILNVYMWGHLDSIKCTQDHKLYVYSNGQLQWVEAGKLKSSDLIALPIPQGKTRAVSRVNKRINKILNDADCWRLIGYWIAEGAASKGNLVRLTFGKHEELTLAADAAKIVIEKLQCSVSVKPNKKTCVVSFSDADFKRITLKFGSHAYNKHIPPLAIASKRHYRVEMVKGYFRGDGCPVSNGWTACSVSPSLITGMQLVLASLGIPAVCRVTATPRRVQFPDGIYDTKTAYAISAHHPLMNLLMETEAKWPRNPCRLTIIPGFLLSPIRKIVIGEKTPLYDLQVANDHSFVVVGGAVHNCIVKDDMATFEASQSQVVMQGVKDWHRSSRSLFDQPRTDIEIIIGTPWSLNDVYQDIETPGSSIYDPSVEVYKRSIVEDGKPILPYKFDLDDVERMQKEFGSLFSLLYMCKPYDPSLVDFDSADLRYFDIQDGFLHFTEDERDAEIVGLLKKAGGGSKVTQPQSSADLRGQPLNADTYRLMRGDRHFREKDSGYKREDWFKR